MTQRLSRLVIRLLSILVGFLAEFLRFGRGLLRPRASLVAENLFLKKQLAFYRERHVAPRRLTDTAKLSLLLWSRWFDWRNAFFFVKPETLIGWHRRAFQIFWRWKSQGGRPRLPKNLRALTAFQTLRQGCSWRRKFTDTMFQGISQSRRSRCWAGYITNIDLRGLRHDLDEVLAHHKPPWLDIGCHSHNTRKTSLGHLRNRILHGQHAILLQFPWLIVIVSPRLRERFSCAA